MPQNTATRAGHLASVFGQLLAGQPLTISTIAEATSLSRPTVRSLLDTLDRAGLATSQLAQEAPEVGRPASHWSLSGTAGTVVAVDLLPSSALVASARLDGAIITSRRVGMQRFDRDGRLAELAALIADAAEIGAESGALRSVVIANTGTVDAGGRVLDSTFVPEWIGLPLGEALSERLHAPVRVENDINCAAFGEFTARVDDGRLTPYGDLVYVRIHHGLVTGLVLGGRIHRGITFSAGEFGLRFGSPEGDEASRLEAIAQSIGAMAAVLDPSVIVMSPSTATPGPLDAIRERLAERLLPTAPHRAFEEPLLGQGAACVGALALALDDARTQLVGHTSPARRGPLDPEPIQDATKDEGHTI